MSNASTEPTQQEQNAQESLQEAVEDVRSKILQLLEVYPYISRAMIQTGLSPALPPKLWDPVLRDLVTKEVVRYVETSITTHKDRSLTKGIYHLPKFPYPPVTVAQFEALLD